MKHKHLCLLALPFLMLLLNSCGKYVYRTPTIKPSLFQKAGDFEASGNFFQFNELHGGVAITDHIAVTATTAGTLPRRDTLRNFDTSQNLVSENFMRKRFNDNEISIGYYMFNRNQSTLEVFTGYAISKERLEEKFYNYRNSSLDYTKDAKTNLYSRFFIQPAYGIIGDYVDFSIANRFTWVTYNDAKKQTDFISEFSFMVRAGYKNVKLMAQFGLTFTDYNKNPYKYLPFSAGLGIYFVMNNSFKLK
jgi:hypothetical protein